MSQKDRTAINKELRKEKEEQKKQIETFKKQLADDVKEVERLDQAAGDAGGALGGQAPFMEDYQPFSMGEICGDLQESDAITGLAKMQEQK